MTASIWKLHLESGTRESALRSVDRCIRMYNRSPMESSVERYSKGGFMATLKFNHSEKLDWPELVFEVMELSQNLGSGWKILGKICSEFDAVLSKNAGDHISVSGLQWAHCLVVNERDQGQLKDAPSDTNPAVG